MMTVFLVTGLLLAPCNTTEAVTYRITSTRPDSPTLVTYRSSTGDEMYDSLNWGNRDGDTMPWSLTVRDGGGTPRIRAAYYGETHPAPTYTCSIEANGVLLISTTGVGYADCMVSRP